MRRLLLAIAIVAAGSGAALADPSGLLVNGTLVKPIGGEGRVSQASGAGGEILLLPTSSWLVQIGGFGALGGPPAAGGVARDLFDLHLQVGMTTARRDAALAPYACLGLDVLSITTRAEATGESARGTTLGVSAQLGLLGRFAGRGLVKVSGTYLGAIVPGTGDDLGGLVLQLAGGLAFD